MNFDTFFAEMEKGNHVININVSEDIKLNGLDNEALFQLPLLCLIILTMAKGNRKPIVSDIGHLVGEAISETMFNYKTSSQKIEWSANLRIRIIKAISFLNNCSEM